MTSEPADLYGDLGPRPEATQEQLRHAYRALVRRHHPDTRPTESARPDSEAGSRAAAEELERVLAAYAVLGDPARRAAYDLLLGDRMARGTTRSTPSPVRVVFHSTPDSPRPPAIRVGPVRWHDDGRSKP